MRKYDQMIFNILFFSSKITIHFQLNLIRLQYTIALWCICECAHTEDTKEPDGIIVEMKTNEEKNIIALNDIELNVKRRKMKPRQTTSYRMRDVRHVCTLISFFILIVFRCISGCSFFPNGSQQFILLKET